ncbi:MAG: hypothetical protein B9S32_12920 [Verrucomicrobia bacterium Tous-C9LFEB]|nr:MAG: hypothetical protein B9S32_12920 [Verrucomicrobia bacterium Tous-C9LFEB]
MVKHGVGLLLCILIPAALAALFWKIRPASTAPLATPSPTETRDTGSETATDPVTAEHRQLQKAMALDEASARRELDRLATQSDPQTIMTRCMLIIRLTGLNPRLGVEYALKFEGDDLGPRSIAIAAAFYTWAGHDPKGAFEYIATMPPGANRKYAVTTALQTVLKANSAQGIQLATTYLTAEDTQEVIHLLFKAKAESNPRAAADDALQIAHTDTRNTALLVTMQFWTRKNRDEAFAWAHGLPSAEDRKWAIHSIVSTWGETESLPALAYAMELRDVREGDSLVHGIVFGWMTRDQTTAMNWVQALPESTTKAQALEAVIVRLCKPDPHVAANFALTLNPSLLTPTAIGNVLSALSRVSPQEALLWAQKLPAGHMRQDAVDVLNHIVADRSSGPPR